MDFLLGIFATVIALFVANIAIDWWRERRASQDTKETISPESVEILIELSKQRVRDEEMPGAQHEGYRRGVVIGMLEVVLAVQDVLEETSKPRPTMVSLKDLMTMYPLKSTEDKIRDKLHDVGDDLLEWTKGKNIKLKHLDKMFDRHGMSIPTANPEKE